MPIKKAYLILAFCAVCVIALLYGVSPEWFARTFIDVSPLPLNLSHILRAVMGLYLALGFFWLYSAFHSALQNVAVLTTVIFCGGLVSGRLLSLALDGQPAPLLLLYAAIELALIPVGLWVYRRPD